MFNHLRIRFNEDRAQQAILQMYHYPRINRLFYEDYEAFFSRAFRHVLEVKGYGTTPISRNTLQKLRNLYPRYKTFDAYGQIVFAK